MNINTPGMGAHGSQWQAHGYSGSGNVSPLIDTEKNRPAIVCGSSYQVFVDCAEASQVLAREGWDDNPLVFAVNEIGIYLPIVHHWVSLHRNNLGVWRIARWMHPKPVQDTKYHSYESEHGYSWDGLNPIFALSGYFAMQIAWIMGCSPIVLAGCPGSRARRFFEAEARPDGVYDANGVREQLVSEMNRLPEFKRSVRSMSGWTREYFGGISKWPHSQR